MIPKFALALALAAGVAAPVQTALAQDGGSHSCTTDPITQAGPNCVYGISVECKKSYPPDNGCLVKDVAPAPVTIACENLGGYYFCEAYPLDDGKKLFYRWSASSNLNLTLVSPVSGSSPEVTLRCRDNHNGTVSVVVLNGTASATKTIQVACPISPIAN